ncbi:iron-sulfur cluster repair di-iron protein [Clostridium beijerinckii]|uniref:iron-sulfur cluster repair di-iron protein n=1 Tax=Clostridium beijerinckii TaxID=1520 RepID=UPI00098CAC75|nr:iron-sulfur cluster repair di-iron protein [Clostridium beijerinckii]NRT76412.1 regulator of cell morphogenesis and NO signaling [Clostridium beijerinckii]OOM38520.1 iron-sulfur cluster repair protein YtfE [Clostridium beijerinckii]
MNTFNSNQKIGEIVTKFPNAADIFKEYKIDFCCGGDRPLITAINEQGVNEAEILEKINASYEKLQNKLYTNNKNWVEAPFDELVDHIVNVHHGYLYENLPKISELTTKILRVHGGNHPELSKVHKLFHTVKMELEAHLIEEETIQYPAIKEYLRSKSEVNLDKAINIINQLQDEHTGAGDILKELRKVTNDYKAPSDGCNTYKLTYAKLEEMESDIFQHIHLENNILFPRLSELKK